MAGETSGNYHERIAREAEELAQVLPLVGIDATLELAETKAVNFNHGADYLMDQATMILLRSGDPELQEHGFSYLAWDAEHNPDPDSGDSLARNAKYDARHEESRDFARRCFEISLMHFRFAAQKEDFVPTAQYIESLGASIARIGEEGYPDLYRSAIREFAPWVIVAALAHQETESAKVGNTNYEKYQIDELLVIVANRLRTSNPELARVARSVITNDVIQERLAALDADMAVSQALMDGDFETAQTFLTANEYLLIQCLWDPMLDRLEDDPKEARNWANVVLDTIKNARPDYFAQKDYPDMFLGPEVGEIVGILGRTDIMDEIVGPHRKQEMCGQTVCAMANQLGQTLNEKGFAHLETRITHFDIGIKDIVRSHFVRGKQEALSLSTE